MEMDDTADWLSEAGFTSGVDGLWTDAQRRVGAVITTVGVFVGWADVAWPGPSTPVVRLRDVTHLPSASGYSLDEEINRAYRLREEAMRACRFCKTECVPGHMHTDNICQGCAERHLGVVH